MKQHIDGVEMYHPKTRVEWRKWLEKNHAKKTGVWLVYFKTASGKDRVSQADSVEEALCYGWIDGKANTLDENRAMQFFARRKPKSKWSKINKERIEKLTAAKQMTEAGMKAVETGKANGAWDALNDVDNEIIPPDLQKELNRNRQAMKYFKAFPPSSKKIILQWVLDAKRPETRATRISEIVEKAAQNIRANHYQQPKK